MLNTKILKVVPIAIALCTLGACATVEQTDAATTKAADTHAATKTVEATTDEEKQICKRTAIVGSNFKRKVCATAAEWEARSQQDRKTTGDIQRRGSSPGVTN